MKKLIIPVILVLLLGCKENETFKINESEIDMNVIRQKSDEFAPFQLTTDLTVLTAKEREMLPLLFEAAGVMESIFWKEAYGDKEELFQGLTQPDLIKLLSINYGPWERLGDNRPFVPGFAGKPAGAGFYPEDMTKEEFESWDNELKAGLYSLIVRDKEGGLKVLPYHEAFRVEVEKAAALLRQAAILAEDPGLRRYLDARAEALLTDDYFDSDLAWMDMKTNTIDFIIGPIETYEDRCSDTKQLTRLSSW